MQSLKESILNRSVDLNQTLGVLAWPDWVSPKVIKMQRPSTNRGINFLRAKAAEVGLEELSKMDQQTYLILEVIMTFISLSRKTELGKELRNPTTLTNFHISTSYDTGLSPASLGFNGLIHIEFKGEHSRLLKELEGISMPGWEIKYEDGFNWDFKDGWRYTVKFKKI